MDTKEKFIDKFDEKHGIKLDESELKEAVGGGAPVHLGNYKCEYCGSSSFMVYELPFTPGKIDYRVVCSCCLRRLPIDDDELLQLYTPTLR